MLVGELDTMNGILNSIWQKCRLWYIEEEEDLVEEDQQEDILEDTDENQLRKWCIL